MRKATALPLWPLPGRVGGIHTHPRPTGRRPGFTSPDACLSLRDAPHRHREQRVMPPRHLWVPLLAQGTARDSRPFPLSTSYLRGPPTSMFCVLTAREVTRHHVRKPWCTRPGTSREDTLSSQARGHQLSPTEPRHHRGPRPELPAVPEGWLPTSSALAGTQVARPPHRGDGDTASPVGPEKVHS